MGKFKLIDGIESAGRFTIVDSKDVSYTEEKTVKQVLDEQESVAEQVESNTAAIAENTSEIESQSGKIEAVESAVADLVVAVDNAEHKIETKASHTEVDQIKSDVTGKANQSEVNQIKNDVAGKANQSEVNEIKTTVAGKASAETVSQLQTDMSIQTARMDQLVGTVPAGSADEIADARVMIDGAVASNLGSAIRAQVSSLKENVDGIVIKDTPNLFDGNYLVGKKVNGAPPNMSFRDDSSYNSVALIPVEPNTTYTVLVEDKGAENGYYYFKIATATTELATGKTFDGNIQWAKTDAYLKRKVITTGPNDRYLYVQSSINTKPFMQVIEGEYTDFTVNTYGTGSTYNPTSQFNVYNKEHVDEISANVNAVKSHLTEVIQTGKIQKNYSFERGFIDPNGIEREDTTPSEHMRTVEYLSTSEAIADNAKIRPVSNVTTRICYYDSNKTFVTREDVVHNYEIKKSYAYFRVVCYRSKNDGGSSEILFRTAVVWNKEKLNVYPDNATFLDKKCINLFDGYYISGKKLSGDSTYIRIDNASGYNSVALIPVKPNTKYTVLIEDVGPEDGYYYLKICEIFLENATPDNIAQTPNNFIGVYTKEYQKDVTFTTGPEATYVVIQTSKSRQPYMQMAEGVLTDFTTTDYENRYVYAPDATINVYSKEQVDELVKKSSSSNSTFEKNANTITINTSNARYVFKRVTDESINVDTWRLFSGELKSNDGYFTMWSNSDAEGAIKITDEDDFVSGYHGDEILKSIAIFVDGKLLDLSMNYSRTEYNEIKILVESDVYHCNTSSLANVKAFERNKMLVFSGNKVKIGNCYKAVSRISVEQARISLFQCYYKDSSGQEVFTNYNVNSDYRNYALSNPSVKPENSTEMDEAWMSTIYGSIRFKLNKTSGQHYKGTVAENFITSQNRLKFYFDTIFSTEVVEANEVISAEFEFEIN